MSNCSVSSLRSLLSLVVVVVVGLLAFEKLPFISALSCVANVSPTATGLTPAVNCSESPCSWNHAIEWCSRNRSDSSVWSFVLESGTYSFDEETRSLMQIPLGVTQVRIESASPISPAVWCGASAKMNISSVDATAAVDVDIVGVSFTKNSSLTVKHSNVVVENCTFSESIGNRALSIETDGVVAVKNSVFSGNLVGGGGDIQGNVQSVTIQACRFENNAIENGSGGGLMVNGSDGDVWVINSTFVNNIAYGSGSGASHCRGMRGGCGGGGIAVYSTGEIVVHNSAFVNNTATRLTPRGGNAGGGGIWMYAKSVNVVRSNFVGNSAVRNGRVNSGSNGGGGGWVFASNGEVVIEDVYGRNNSAIDNGIGNFNGNSGNGGGCLWIYSLNNRITAHGGIFVENQASRNGIGRSGLETENGNGGWNNGGGALWIWTQNAGDIQVIGGVYAWNVAIGNGQGGSRNLNGNGGAYNGGGAVWMISFGSSSSSVSKCTMVYNSAVENGQGGSSNGKNELGNGNGIGGSYNGGGAINMYSQFSFTNVSNCAMMYNRASRNGLGGSNNIGNGNGGSFNGGGAVWMNSYFTTVSNSTMQYNNAFENGNGGLENTFQSIGGNSNGGGALFSLSSPNFWKSLSAFNEFISNSASQDGMGGTGSTSSTFSSGGSLCGGGAALLIGTSLSHSVFLNNKAEKSGIVQSQTSIGTDGSNNGGGAVLAQNSFLSHCTFLHNTVTALHLSSSGNGGAARLVSGSIIEYSTFDRNSASFRGSAIASGSGNNSISASSFHYNTATFDGGAVIVDVTDVHLFIFFSQFTGNQAQSSRGGALAVVAYLAFISSQNCSFTSNYAESQGGAVAVVAEGGTFISMNDAFFMNQAETFGGVLYSGSGSHPTSNNYTDVPPAFVAANHALFVNNTAGFGGVIMTDDKGTALISSSHAHNNRASHISGGFAHLAVRSQLSLTTTLLDGNSAAVSAGSIYQEHFSYLYMRSVILSKSSAPYAGGMECIHNSFASISNRSEFSHNRATEQESGALHSAGSALLFIRDSLFMNNSAPAFGGALFLTDSSSVYLFTSYLVENSAIASGGGGFFLSSSSTLTLDNSSFISNQALGGAGGCGFVSDSSSLLSRHSVFFNNKAEQGDGGAMSFGSSRFPLISSSQFLRNQAWRGGALSFNVSSIWSAFSSSDSIWLRGSTFIGNIAFSVLQQQLQSSEIGLLAPGGGGAIFFNLPTNTSLWNAYQIWKMWNTKSHNNTFLHNIAVYGQDAASVAITPFVVAFPSDDDATRCHPVDSFSMDNSFDISNFNHILSTMPGLPISLHVGVCDAFGQSISTLEGGTVLYSWKNLSISAPSVIRTSTNGTGDIFSHLPVLRSKSFYSFYTRLSGSNVQALPTFALVWQSSACSPFYGFSSPQGCVLCSPSQYSIDVSFESSVDCNQLSSGSSCFSVLFPRLQVPLSSWSNYSIPNPETAQVTVVQVESGYWPALSKTSAQTSVVTRPCPFDYCLRMENLYVTGEQSPSLVKTSHSTVCREGSFRDSASPLCGGCVDGYVDWNYECYHCPNGPQPGYVIIFVLFVFGWTLIQLILAQQGGSGSITAMLFFLTQSLTWFTYPRGVLHTVKNLVNFRFHLSTANECYIDVSGTIELFLRVLVPMLYFAALWIIYVIHISLAWCLSRQEISSSRKSATTSRCQTMLFYSRNILVSTASADPYQRTTALLLLSMFPSILDAVFSVWTCLDVPMGTTTLSVVALTPTVECGTESWWVWNVFYMLVLFLLLSIIAFVVFATTKARDERQSSSLRNRHFINRDRHEQLEYAPFSLSEKFGTLWREAFRDHVPWWTAMELVIRLALIAIFSLSVTRIPTYTNFILGLAILGWMIMHNYFSPFRDQDIDRMVLIPQYSMLIMAMIASTNQIESDTPIIFIFVVYGTAAGILGIHIARKLVQAIRMILFSFEKQKRQSSSQISAISLSLLEPARTFMQENPHELIESKHL